MTLWHTSASRITRSTPKSRTTLTDLSSKTTQSIVWGRGGGRQTDGLQQFAAMGTLQRQESPKPNDTPGSRKATRQLGNIADVAATLTRVRGDTSDWKWVGDIARLETNDRVIELRPKRGGNYEPLQAKGEVFRRIPSIPDGSLKELVSRVG